MIQQVVNSLLAGRNLDLYQRRVATANIEAITMAIGGIGLNPYIVDRLGRDYPHGSFFWSDRIIQRCKQTPSSKAGVNKWTKLLRVRADHEGRPWFMELKASRVKREGRWYRGYQDERGEWVIKPSREFDLRFWAPIYRMNARLWDWFIEQDKSDFENGDTPIYNRYRFTVDKECEYMPRPEGCFNRPMDLPDLPEL